MVRTFWVLSLASALALSGCPRRTVDLPDAFADAVRVDDGGFQCLSVDDAACIGNVWTSCERDGEWLRMRTEDCAAAEPPRVCAPRLGCVVCVPRSESCIDGRPAVCRDDGSGWDLGERCAEADGVVCREGACVDLCREAEANRSYVGCEFFAVDLDNAALAAGRDASSQQYAVVVSNTSFVPANIEIEVDHAPRGMPERAEVIASVVVPPGDLEVLRLPRREVDGSSSFVPCSTAEDDVCASNESCWCAGGVRPGAGTSDCRCRVSASALGLNDGTHSAVTSNAYRVRSSVPVVAYQFNPLDNVGVFSNDASLLLPVSGIGREYTVVTWPQTIADSDRIEENFDPNRDDEDLRSFLTVVGTGEGTDVTVRLGPSVRRVVPLEGTSFLLAGDDVRVRLGAFDVLNLETQGFNADFTGTRVIASNVVAVFAGSEASDAPRFADLANRRCCADHLEEQLFPDHTLGQSFFIGRTPTRSRALNAAFVTADSVADVDEPEYVRIVAVAAGVTEVRTSLPPPRDLFTLEQYEDALLVADQDFVIEADEPLAVLQVLASQEATGIPSQYPGGDPSIIAVPPTDQYRREYVFLTPLYYGFDFVTIVAPTNAEILLDEEPLDPRACSVGPADGVRRDPGDPPPRQLVYRCQLSFPDVLGLPNVRVEAGDQHDGYHTLRATDPVSLIVSGFDRFVSYAYAGGLDLRTLR